jgi:hypothetical protein
MADMVPQGVQREGRQGGYERGDANIRAVVMTMSFIMGTVFLVMLVIGGMSYALQKREESHDVALSAVYERPIPPEPRLLPSRAAGEGDPYDKQPWELGQQEREAQVKAATTPYWINKSRGQVSIPTAQALEATASQGLPTRQTQGADQPGVGDDLAGSNGANSQDTADADLDGTMVPDTTGGRAMSDSLVRTPSLGMESPSAVSAPVASASAVSATPASGGATPVEPMNARAAASTPAVVAPAGRTTGTMNLPSAAKSTSAAGTTSAP